MSWLERNFTISVFDHMQMRQLQIRLHENFATFTYGYDHDLNPKKDLRTTTLTYIMIYIFYYHVVSISVVLARESAIQEGGTSSLESSRNALSTEQEREPR